MYTLEVLGAEKDILCDPYIQIFLDGELSKTTETFDSTEYRELTLDYRTKLIPKTSNIQFLMMDADTGSDPDELLNRAFSVRELTNLTNTKYMKIFANQRPDKGSKTGVSDNYIEIYQSVWTDEYLTP